MVPSAEQEQGSAQRARGFLGPLTDSKSTGLQRVFTFLEQLPPWVQPLQDGDATALEAAYAWLQTENGQQLLKTSGGRTQWGRLARANDPAWPHQFLDDVDRKCREAATGPPMRVRHLKAHGVLPLFRPYLAPRIASAKGALSRWDHLAFRLAIGHLLGWETQCHQTIQTYLAHQERLAAFEAQYGTDVVQAALTELQAYETQRQPGSRVSISSLKGPRYTSRIATGVAPSAAT